jgi:hypothetical protein
MELAANLHRVGELARAYSAPGESLSGVVPTEAREGERIYLCAFEAGGGKRSWLAIDDAGRAVEDRARVREAASIAALCEIAADTAAGGDLDELRSQLVALRLTENPPGIDEAEDAVLALQRVVATPVAVASPARLDAVGVATRRVESALGDGAGSPFAEAMKSAMGAVESLTEEIEQTYKLPLAA